MIPAIANLDILGVGSLVFGIWIAVSLFVGPMIGRFLRGVQPPPDLDLDGLENEVQQMRDRRTAA